jgi:hypothetical protein
MTRIPVNPKLLTWARERAGLDRLAPPISPNWKLR